jgi:hypothetical protein
MHSRRSFLASGAAGALVATAGCLDFILGDDLSFSASPANVSDDALDSTGYEENQTREQSFEKEFSVGGESRTVGITNHYAEYDRSIDLSGLGIGSQRAATFTAATTPKVEVLGETFNPIDDMSPAEILGRAQGRYGGIDDLQEVGEFDTTLLGKETTVTRFHGSAELGDTGQNVDVELQVSDVVGSNGDFALAIGGYPQQLSDSERDNYETLVAGVQHDG